jgi:hypothetical protein
MKVVVVVDPSVRLVGQYPVTYRYTCSLCGREWDGPPPTCGADGVCLVTMVFCSEDCGGREGHRTGPGSVLMSRMRQRHADMIGKGFRRYQCSLSGSILGTSVLHKDWGSDLVLTRLRLDGCPLGDSTPDIMDWPANRFTISCQDGRKLNFMSLDD